MFSRGGNPPQNSWFGTDLGFRFMVQCNFGTTRETKFVLKFIIKTANTIRKRYNPKAKTTGKLNLQRLFLPCCSCTNTLMNSITELTDNLGLINYFLSSADVNQNVPKPLIITDFNQHYP